MKRGCGLGQEAGLIPGEHEILDGVIGWTRVTLVFPKA